MFLINHVFLSPEILFIMKNLLPVSLFVAIMAFSASVHAQFAYDINDAYVKNNGLTIVVKVACGSASWERTFKMDLNEDRSIASLPPGVSLDAENHYLFYTGAAETCDSGERSVAWAFQLTELNRVPLSTGEPSERHSCAGNPCGCCRFILEGGYAIGCYCESTPPCSGSQCNHTLTTDKVRDL